MPISPVAGVVAVIGDQHALRAVRLERGQQLVGEALHAIGRRHVAVARAPEGQRVDQRLGQDDLARGGERGAVEDPGVRARQVQVLGRARAQVVQQLAAVHLDHVAALVEHRDYQGAVEVLVAAFSDQADLLQPGADVGAGLARLLRQPQAQRTVGHAELEGRDQLGMRQAARLEVSRRLSRGLQALVVVVDGLVQQRPVVGVEGHRRRQAAHRRALDLAGLASS
jgi:hypothetical protein